MHASTSACSQLVRQATWPAAARTSQRAARILPLLCRAAPAVLHTSSPAAQAAACSASAGAAGAAPRQPATRQRRAAPVKPMQPVAPAAPPRTVEPAAGRQAMREELPLESLRVAGVSFEGRQDLLAALQPEAAVAFVAEPDNPHDPAAVAVRLLDGRGLGYVPRDLTPHFRQPLTFGHVHHVGQNDKGLWGALVAVRAALPPLAVEALPESLAALCDLATHLPAREWERLCKAAREATANRCSVSGADGPLVCGARWSVDEAAGVVRLEGLAPLAPELAPVPGLAAVSQPLQRQQGLFWLQTMNEWTAAEAEQHLAAARQQAAARSAAQQQWRLDLAWLAQQGAKVPRPLQALAA